MSTRPKKKRYLGAVGASRIRQAQAGRVLAGILRPAPPSIKKSRGAARAQPAGPGAIRAGVLYLYYAAPACGAGAVSGDMRLPLRYRAGAVRSWLT